MARRVTADDLLAFQVVGEPQASPDGRRVAFVVTRLDGGADAYRSRIWVLDTATGAYRPLTAGPADTCPRWSPDGSRLAFLRGEGGVFVLPLTGGEAVPVGADLQGAMEVRWSPDGRQLGVMAHAVVADPATAALREALAGADGDADRFVREQPASGLRVTRRLTYRFDALGYHDDRRRHVFLVAADPNAREAPRDLTPGAFDVDAFAWHPGGGHLTYVANRDEEADGSLRRDVWSTGVQDGGERRLLSLAGGANSLVWSPAGGHLAVAGHDGSHGHATQAGLWIFDEATGQSANVTAGFDRSVGSGVFGDVRRLGLPQPPAWSRDGRTVFFPAASEGDAPIFAARVDGTAPATVEALRSGGVAVELAAGPESLWFTAEDPEHPAELWELSLAGGAAVRRTRINDPLLAELELGRREHFTFAGAGGLSIPGWLTLPPDFAPGRRYPLVLQIHGGPHGCYGASFNHEWHARAAAGRIVLTVNPRGSGGYGQEFTSACVGDWGGDDYLDLMAGVEAVVARGFVDEKRMAVTGISYGGFMTGWVVTHTRRFAVAITEMCVSNLLSFYGTSDIGTHFAEFEIPGRPWEGAEALWAHSPLKYVGDCATPTLVIGGEADHRCPIEQGEQFYASLRRRGVEAAMIRFPGASHVFSIIGKPSQRLGRLRAMEAWLAAHGV